MPKSLKTFETVLPPRLKFWYDAQNCCHTWKGTHSQTLSNSLWSWLSIVNNRDSSGSLAFQSHKHLKRSRFLLKTVSTKSSNKKATGVSNYPTFTDLSPRYYNFQNPITCDYISSHAIKGCSQKLMFRTKCCLEWVYILCSPHWNKFGVV